MTMPDTLPSQMTAIETVPVSVLCMERCHLGEGPSYDAGTDTAWWFDILERRLFEARLETGRITIHDLPVMASALAQIDAGRQMLAAEDGLYLREIASGKLTRVAEFAGEDGPIRSNDGRVHQSGTFWISTMGRGAEAGAGAIHAFRGGSVALLFSGLTIPNAICFSPDGCTGYFADTRENTLYRVALDPVTGLPVEAPSILHKRDAVGGLDGAVTDAQGLIWCAIWGGGCVDVYSPRGDRLRSIAMPARQPSCPVFVGPRFDRLLVTSAHENMNADARAADPDHGRTFLADVGAVGRAEPRLRWGGS
ncbi:SMP-30/gluconolactonase/LRE family protein [Bosea sp. F3-2]|uniref:SMP-30/gluconolactonase/LRE family protein n=1 Tax=Bosea sp. F3-2 TaxID=2599640 RepID=UPI0020BD7357|nr:SMP-30/gluconolactonase/LRE family protein [Bosea sp. F3-2]